MKLMINTRPMLVLLLGIQSALLIAQDCSRPTFHQDFTTPGLTAPHTPSGSLWFGQNWTGLRINDTEPQNFEAKIVSAGAIWMAGKDINGNIKAACNTYGPGIDFWPGPLTTEGNITSTTCDDYDFIWEVRGSYISDFKSDWEDNGQLDQPISIALLAWPGKDNPHSVSVNGFKLPANYDMAPFIDVDQDDIYDPMKGDYPDINDAELAHWWIFNDKGNLHGETNSTAIGVEIKCLAFSYDTEEFGDQKIFYEYEIINKSEVTLSDAHIGLWLDTGIGCFGKEALGCSSENDLAYFYSTTSVESGCDCGTGQDFCSKELLSGIKVLRGLKNESSDDLGMTSFIHYNNSGIGNFPLGSTDPQTASEYYNYLQGIWRDGTPQTVGGIGYNPNTSEPVTFAFDGNPADPNAWTLCEDNPPSDRRMVIGSGPSILKPGEKYKFTFAFILTREVDELPCPDISTLINVGNEAQLIYDEILSGVKNAKNNLGFSVYPNPTNDFININLPDGENIFQLILRNANGQKIAVEKVINSNKHLLNMENPSGVYFLEIITSDNKRGVEKIIVNSD